MQYLYYVLFLTSIHNVELYFIENNKKPICANCKFFIHNKNECRKFGDINLITGIYTYEPAVNVRNDDDKCGESAFMFEKNYFKFITIPYYFLLEDYNISFLLSFLLSFAFFYIILFF
jgi:hypothetical protein